MKVIIQKELLIELLQKCIGPATSKQNFPILNSVLINSTPQKIIFTTTDLDITIISSQRTEIIETGQAVLPMKRFFSIIRELPSQEISLETIENNLLIKCGKIEFKINTLNVEEFPQSPENKDISLIKIAPSQLEEMIKLTSFCVGYEDVNYVLGGILFEIKENKLSLVSTDGKRLAFIQKSLPSSQPEIKTKISFVLPIKAVNELNKLLKEKDEEIYLSIGNNWVEFDFKETRFIARPLEGEFPNYSQYIPTQDKEKLEVNRQHLLSALRRAHLLSTPDYQGVKLQIKKDKVMISKHTPQLGEVREEVDVKYGGEPLEVGFNPLYLIDVLKNLIDREVSISFFGVDKPAVLRREGYVYLLLPIKI